MLQRYIVFMASLFCSFLQCMDYVSDQITGDKEYKTIDGKKYEIIGFPAQTPRENYHFLKARDQEDVLYRAPHILIQETMLHSAIIEDVGMKDTPQIIGINLDMKNIIGAFHFMELWATYKKRTKPTSCYELPIIVQRKNQERIEGIGQKSKDSVLPVETHYGFTLAECSELVTSLKCLSVKPKILDVCFFDFYKNQFNKVMSLQECKLVISCCLNILEGRAQTSDTESMIPYCLYNQLSSKGIILSKYDLSESTLKAIQVSNKENTKTPEFMQNSLKITHSIRDIEKALKLCKEYDEHIHNGETLSDDFIQTDSGLYFEKPLYDKLETLKSLIRLDFLLRQVHKKPVLNPVTGIPFWVKKESFSLSNKIMVGSAVLVSIAVLLFYFNTDRLKSYF